jgi:hypothetical protein
MKRLETFNNVQLVTIAVAQLGGATEEIDKEDVAIFVHKVAPKRFSWRRYPENIDISIVKDALNDAKKTRYNALLVGNNISGWMLSPNGIRWLESVDIDRDTIEADQTSRKGSITANQEFEVLRLKQTRAFQLFIENRIAEITINDFYTFARVNEYFLKGTLKKRFSAIENAIVHDSQLVVLWGLLKERFITG